MTRDSELQQQRELVREKIKLSQKERAKNLTFVSQQIDEVVSGFSNNTEILITFEDLRLFDIGERIAVNDSLNFEKIYQDENKMIFLTHILDGGSFGLHNHNCYEITKILKGNLIERNYGMKVYNEGEQVIYCPNENHRPYATMDSTYEVTFIKDII